VGARRGAWDGVSRDIGRVQSATIGSAVLPIATVGAAAWLSHKVRRKPFELSPVTTLRRCTKRAHWEHCTPMGARVLLVEHDEPLRTSIVRALRARGVGVDPFATPAEALAAVEAGGIWMRALIDLALPEMDGATLAERLLQTLPELEITFATGGIDASVLCKAHGLGTVIWKPLGLGPLCERFAAQHRGSGTFVRRGARRASSMQVPAVDPAAATGSKK
jgi:CheY-like chemotaxis protein